MNKVKELKNIGKLVKFTSIIPIEWKKFKTEINVIKKTNEILWEKIKNSEDKIFLMKLLTLEQR